MSKAKKKNYVSPSVSICRVELEESIGVNVSTGKITLDMQADNLRWNETELGDASGSTGGSGGDIYVPW
jgi:hypothetical protein